MTIALEAGLVGRDEQALCDFYTGVMGFVLVDRREFDVGTVCKLRRGDARLKIFLPRDAVDPVVPVTTGEPWFGSGGWRYAALELEQLDDVDALVAAVDAGHGRVLLAPANHRERARTAMIADPEGNAWELLAEARDEEDVRP
jgi:catechol 2,3-dioxygenase-like lactoylglutathione lyase family enzyme